MRYHPERSARGTQFWLWTPAAWARDSCQCRRIVWDVVDVWMCRSEAGRKSRQATGGNLDLLPDDKHFLLICQV